MGSSKVLISPKVIGLLSLFMVLSIIGAAEVRPPPVTEATLHQIAASLQMYVDELPQIPKLLGYTPSYGAPKPGKLTIGMYKTTWKFHRDFPPTTVFAYGTSAAAATVPGPQIEAIQGVPTYVTWLNYLPDHHILPWDPTIATAIPKNGGVPTVVHLHGGIHPPQSDGNALAWFTANFRENGPKWTQSTYMYPNVQHAGNLWYHDHALGLTRVNLLAGLIAPFVIKDPALEAKLNLPSGPEFDRHLMIFDRSFYMDGSLYMNYTGDNPTIHPQWQPEYFGDAMIVNGKAWPCLKVQPRKYRFRIINASNARYLSLSLTNGLEFIIVGSDTSYLPSPVTSSNILIAPAEIFDVVVDFSLAKASEIMLTNDAPYPYPNGTSPDQLTSKVMKFIIKPEAPVPYDKSSVPQGLKTYATSSITEATTKRYIVMYEYQSSTGNPTHLLINGKRLVDPATETPKSGSTEVWEVINLTGDNHPLHLHLAEFQAIKVQQLVDLAGFTTCMKVKNDAIACNVTSHATGSLLDIPAYEKTWKNVVKIEPGYQTTVVVKFNLVENDVPYPFDATVEPNYLYHCHILDHEDNEMIRPLKLVK
ncbi:multicopper oxidase LPR1 homolog 1-like [Coffea eugenioides]|uniref:multicopper oxidase LPR1 homolog 1-like n=1 Tax=Coffea eugenioides TaxID=49369 RepID=UPI000F615691|nr:multicopper oxidase LPR1 homolog 1-like [Coffea eugenioides]